VVDTDADRGARLRPPRLETPRPCGGVQTAVTRYVSRVTDPLDTVPDLLAETGPATAPELARRLGAHPVAVERRCERLLRAGRLRRTTGGRYVVCEADGPRRAAD
jgi:Mn-dependent DtxR family transcriptional regulator